MKRGADEGMGGGRDGELGAATAGVVAIVCGPADTGITSNDCAGARGESCACVKRDSMRPMARTKFTSSALEEGGRDAGCIAGAEGGSGLVTVCLGVGGYDGREADRDEESLNHLTALVTAASSMPGAGFSSGLGLSFESSLADAGVAPGARTPLLAPGK